MVFILFYFSWLVSFFMMITDLHDTGIIQWAYILSPQTFLIAIFVVYLLIYGIMIGIGKILAKIK